jgi:hypothetical protein
VKLATEVYRTIDILVNHAGIYPPGSTLVIDGETFDRTRPKRRRRS